MKNLFGRSASACLLVLLSCATAAAQADQTLPAVGGSGGNDFYARCPAGQHLLGFNLRAGHNIDAIQPICGVPMSETQVQVTGQMRGYGGTGGQPAQVTCPSQATAAAAKPVVLGLYLKAEGIHGLVLNNIHLYCGIVAAQQQIPTQPAAQYDAPSQEGTYGALATGHEKKWRSGTPMCPPGLIGVGVYGRAGAAIDSLGLICGAAQTGFGAAGRTLGKRKRPQDDTAGRTLGKRKLPQDRTAGRTLGKRRSGAGAETSTAAEQGALAAARASVNPALYDQYIGKYLINPLDYFTINREGNRLYVMRDKKFELIPRSETDFSVGSSEAVIRFNKNREGGVVSLTYMGLSDYAPVYWREGVAQPPVKNPF